MLNGVSLPVFWSMANDDSIPSARIEAKRNFLAGSVISAAGSPSHFASATKVSLPSSTFRWYTAIFFSDASAT